MQRTVIDSECLWTFQALFIATPSSDSVLKGGSYIFFQGAPRNYWGQEGEVTKPRVDMLAARPREKYEKLDFKKELIL